MMNSFAMVQVLCGFDAIEPPDRSQGARSQPQVNREGFNDSQWKWKNNDDQNMKNERIVQKYHELLIVYIEKHWSTGKKTCCFKQLGIGWWKGWFCGSRRWKSSRPHKNHPRCHGLSPLRGTTTGAARWNRYGETQRGTHNGETQWQPLQKKSYVNKIWKEKLNQLEMWFKQFWDMKSWFISNIFRWFSFMFSIAFEKLIDIYSDIQRVLTDIYCDI